MFKQDGLWYLWTVGAQTTGAGMQRTYFVRAVWDKEAGVFVSESDIIGLHIEAETVDEFEATMRDVATDLLIANHESLQ
jgi:hypothetical protein